MKLEVGVSPNCSEAVFRFYTLNPEHMQKILQALADEVRAYCGQLLGEAFPEWVREAHVPLYEKAEDYQGEQAFRAPAGVGNDSVIVTVERKRGTFVVNIGNNAIAENITGWKEKVRALGVAVQEAETCPELKKKYARDCTCGIVFFGGSGKS